MTALPRKSRAPKAGGVTGFGCPVEMFIHHVEVTIPEGRGSKVLFEEDWGVAQAGGPDRLLRCALPRGRWNAIATIARQVLNERLQEQELPPSRWVTGINRVERLLGKEAVVLAWAVEAVEGKDVRRLRLPGRRCARKNDGGSLGALHRWRVLPTMCPQNRVVVSAYCSPGDQIGVPLLPRACRVC